MSNEQKKKLSRRKALRMVAGSAGAAVSFPILNSVVALPSAGDAHTAAASQPGKSAPKFLSPDEIRTLGALTETIIPTDDHSPGALAAGVPEWIDAYLAESGESRKRFWLKGLARVDQMAQESLGRKFADCSPEQRVESLRQISADEERPRTLEAKFFVALKHATIDGYYNSKVGIRQELEYRGNTALAEFPGCLKQP